MDRINELRQHQLFLRRCHRRAVDGGHLEAAAKLEALIQHLRKQEVDHVAKSMV